MTVTTTKPAAREAATKKLAGIVMHAIWRATVPAVANRNKLDELVSEALARAGTSEHRLRRLVRGYRRLPADRKLELFGREIPELNVEHAIDLVRLESIVESISEGVELPPAPPSTDSYALSFSHLVCDDESNPEWLGSDEAYVVFGAITERQIEAGLQPTVVATPVYEDIDDGDRRPPQGSEGLEVFAADPFDSPMLVTASAFEHDLGDVADTVESVALLLGIAALVAAEAGGPGSPVFLVLAAAFLITLEVGKAGQDDPIGPTSTFSLSPEEAEGLTAATGRATLERLTFDGGDVGGRYRAFLDLARR